MLVVAAGGVKGIDEDGEGGGGEGEGEGGIVRTEATHLRSVRRAMLLLALSRPGENSKFPWVLVSCAETKFST